MKFRDLERRPLAVPPAPDLTLGRRAQHKMPARGVDPRVGCGPHAALTFRIGAGQRWSPDRDAVRRPTQTTGAALLARETDLVEELLLPFVRALELLERGAVLPPRVTGLYEP